MRSRSVVVSLLALVLAACGTQGEAPIGAPGASPSRDTLFVRTAQGIQALAASGEVELEVPGGAASPDFEVLVAVESDGTGTEVRRLGASEEVLSETSLRGEFTARVVSQSGDLVALTDPGASGATPYLPVGRKRTPLVVTESSGGHRQYLLEGNFEPEAFSVDERELFMIEYIPAQSPRRYRVRRLVLGSGKVIPIGRLKSAAPDQMNGTGRTQVYSPNGDELYTLYTQQEQAGHHAPSAGGGHAFVHLLNLRDSWAHCIDLPHAFGAGQATAGALAVAEGGPLYVVDWTGGAIAVVRPDRVRVAKTIDVEFGPPDDRTFAVASSERLWAAGNDAIVALDRETLEVVDRWELGAEITGMKLSPDEMRLYASVGGEIVSLDARSGAVLHTLQAPNSTIEHVAP